MFYREGGRDVSSNRYQCSRLVSIATKFWGVMGKAEGKRDDEVATIGGIQGISPIKIDERHDVGDVGARTRKMEKKGAPQVPQRKRYLWGMFFGAAVSLIEIDYLEPGVPFFREDASPPNHPVSSVPRLPREGEAASQLLGTLASPILGYSYFTWRNDSRATIANFEIEKFFPTEKHTSFVEAWMQKWYWNFQ